MNRLDAHAILNAAQAGAFVSQAKIMEALKATGDLDPIKRADNEPTEVRHKVPAFVDRYKYGRSIGPRVTA